MYQNIPLGSYIQASVPTVKMRNGDFSEFLNTSLVSKPVIVNDPYNGNTPFPNNQIPSSRFSGVSKTIMDKYYSLTTNPGTPSPTTTAGRIRSTTSCTRATGRSSASTTR
jgi:hypothetical protein